MSSASSGDDFVQNLSSTTEYDGCAERLIEEVRKCPWLYDLRRQDYKDSRKKRNTWLAISKVVKSSPDDCLQKWKNLKDRFTEEVRLSKSKRARDGVVARESTWPMMKPMSFLESHIRKRTTFGPRHASAFKDAKNGSGPGSDVDFKQFLHGNADDNSTEDSSSNAWHVSDYVTRNVPSLVVPTTSSTPSTSPSDSESSQYGTTTKDANKEETSRFETESVNTLKASRTIKPVTSINSNRQVKGDAEYYFAMYVAQRMRVLSTRKKSVLQAKVIEMLRSFEDDVTAGEPP